ncbi:hypothetical protein GCM10007304_05700 [Rhodococcoides trifolii]|uniref:Uncharacterized protein n=1 Tax=Rhodococcoides trifolii TaxID=908250 RepID=A0A917CPV1_9NOCA|nr:hypothetical protein [Rhodococcus trifolii]GGF94706.1 hypothetical protein GCM10007304_05700 [Rhodococcus trifolii]
MSRFQHVRPALLVVTAVLTGVLGGFVFASPRSDGWVFNASLDDTAGWLTAQATATSVGAFVVVLSYALWSWFSSTSPRPLWVVITITAILVTFVKVTVPDAASVDVLTFLHILKCCAAGVLVGTAAYAVRRSRPGWVALAGGVSGGYLLSATQGVVDGLSNQYAPSFPYSSSVFGEAAWWLLVAVVVTAVACTVEPPQSQDAPPGPDRSVALRMVMYAAIVAVVGRVVAAVIVRRIPDGGYGLWVVAAVCVAAFVVTVDVVSKRWDHHDARLPLAAVAVTASSVSVWSSLRAAQQLPQFIPFFGGIGALVLAAALAWRVRRRTMPWLGLGLLAASPLVSALVRSEVESVAAVVLTGFGATLLIGSLTIPADAGNGDDSVRALAVAIPGMAGVFATAAMLPSNTELVGASLAELFDDSTSILGYTRDTFSTADRFGEWLMFAVVAYCALRIAMSRPKPAPMPEAL